MADTLKLDQYDDDLTIGLDDFNEDLYVDEDDLLRFQPPESPLANLQSIVVSIDWEISDEILLQFNEEILALREIWTDEKIYLVYLQALEQISKYIYQEKAAAHPSAVKLLPLFFRNLEKISSFDFDDEEEKQAILIADVKRFNFLKKEISTFKGSKSVATSGDEPTALKSLKALVLGIDWEVTESDLADLRREVMFLENLYSSSKPRLILLQGIGTLAVYIQHKSGDADAGAFPLLHDFFATLERLATSSLTVAEEKEALLVEVEKFNLFKAKIANTLSPEAIERDEKERSKEIDPAPASTVIVPAFSDVDPARSSGFQEDVVAEELGDSEELATKISTFFPDNVEEEVAPLEQEESSLGDVAVEAESRLDDFFGDDAIEHATISERDLALQGVSVEIEGDDDDLEDDAPLLSDEDSPAFIGESQALEEKVSIEEPPLAVEDEAASRLDDFFGSMEEVEPEKVDKSFALQGVDVETEADDDSEEIALNRVGDELAPALAVNDDVLLEEDIESRLDSFFNDDDEVDPRQSAPAGVGVADTSQGSDQKTESLTDADTGAVSDATVDDFDTLFDNVFGEEEGAEKVESNDRGTVKDDELLNEDDIEATLDSFFEDFGDEPLPASVTGSPATQEEFVESIAPALSFVDESVAPAHHEQSVEESEQESLLTAGLEDTLDAFFTGKEDVEFAASPEEELFVDDVFATVDDATFEPEDVVEESVEEQAAVVPPSVELEEVVASPPVSDDFDVAIAGSDLDVVEDETLEPTVSEVAEVTEALFVEVDEDIPEDYVAGEELEEVQQDVNLAPVVEAAAQEDDQEPVFTVVEDGDDALFADIRGSVSSLSFDLSEAVVDGVLNDINALRQRLSGDPVAKSFLQLMSTLSQHIRRYQYEASSEAFTLLLAIHEKLETTITSDLLERQNTLMTETYKVLQWQQNLIESREDFIKPPEEEPVTVEDDEESDLFSEGEDELIYAVHEEEMANKDHDVEILRGELQELRVTLQDELASLRRDLTKR